MTDKKPVIPSEEAFEELNDDELFRVSGGVANTVDINAQQSLSGFAPTTARVANAQGSNSKKSIDWAIAFL